MLVLEFCCIWTLLTSRRFETVNHFAFGSTDSSFFLKSYNSLKLRCPTYRPLKGRRKRFCFVVDIKGYAANQPLFLQMNICHLIKKSQIVRQYREVV